MNLQHLEISSKQDSLRSDQTLYIFELDRAVLKYLLVLWILGQANPIDTLLHNDAMDCYVKLRSDLNQSDKQ